MLKQVRNELLSRSRPMLEVLIRDIVGVEIQSVHTDISTKTGERMIVFTLQSKPTFRGSAEEKASYEAVTLEVEMDDAAER